MYSGEIMNNLAYIALLMMFIDWGELVQKYVKSLIGFSFDLRFFLWFYAFCEICLLCN